MRFTHKTGLAAALLGCALATPAFAASKANASPFSYNYAQLSYVDLDAGFDGFKIEGSFDINPTLALTTSYLSTDKKNYLEYDVFTLGLAYHQRLVDMPKADLVLHGEFERSHASHVHSDNENGVRIGAMLRYQVQKNIETFGDLSYSSLYDNDLALTAGINLALNQQFSVVAAVELSDNDMLLLGIRMQLK